MNDDVSSALRELQGLRLMRAFLRIRNDEQRLELLRLAEELAEACFDRRDHGLVGPRGTLTPEPTEANDPC